MRIPSGSCSRGNFCAPSRWGAEGALPTAERAGVKVFSRRCSLRAGASERRIAELKTLLGKTVAVQVRVRREAERVWSKSLSRGCGSRAGRLRGMKGERMREAGLCVPACPARSMRTRAAVLSSAARFAETRAIAAALPIRCEIRARPPLPPTCGRAPSSPLQPSAASFAETRVIAVALPFAARFARARHCRRHADAPPLRHPPRDSQKRAPLPPTCGRAPPFCPLPQDSRKSAPSPLRPSAARFAETRAIAAAPIFCCEIRGNARPPFPSRTSRAQISYIAAAPRRLTRGKTGDLSRS